VLERHGLSAANLTALVAAGDWDALDRLRDSRRSRPALAHRAAALRDRLGRVWTWRGISVAVMGPDGAGKTTLVTGLRDTFPFPTRTIYMGLTGGRLPWADRLRVPGVVLGARLAVLWTRYAASIYHRARGRIVLFDRYLLDATVPSGLDLRPLARASRRLQGSAVPRPTVVILLDASGATLHDRSLEYDPATLESWRVAYQRLHASVRDLEVIDAEQSADDVRRQAYTAVWTRYAQRWRRRALRRLNQNAAGDGGFMGRRS
jgi:thymidylate kinase